MRYRQDNLEVSHFKSGSINFSIPPWIHGIRPAYVWICITASLPHLYPSLVYPTLPTPSQCSFLVFFQPAHPTQYCSTILTTHRLERSTRRQINSLRTAREQPGGLLMNKHEVITHGRGTNCCVLSWRERLRQTVGLWQWAQEGCRCLFVARY